MVVLQSNKCDFLLLHVFSICYHFYSFTYYNKLQGLFHKETTLVIEIIEFIIQSLSLKKGSSMALILSQIWDLFAYQSDCTVQKKVLMKILLANVLDGCRAVWKMIPGAIIRLISSHFLRSGVCSNVFVNTFDETSGYYIHNQTFYSNKYIQIKVFVKSNKFGKDHPCKVKTSLYRRAVRWFNIIIFIMSKL